MIGISQKEHRIGIYLTADVINTSTERADIVSLKRAIVSQLEQTYRCAAGPYHLSLKADIGVLYRVRDCSPVKVLFEVTDQVTHNNAAEAQLRSLRIKLNKAIVNDIIYGRNTRTVPHELGHLLGWEHPHARAAYASVNPEAHPLEQAMSEAERGCNLMSQGWYIQRAGVPMADAQQITGKQVELMLHYYRSGQLNRNLHLRNWWIWKKLL